MKNWGESFFLSGVVIVIFAVSLIFNPFSAPFAAAQEKKTNKAVQGKKAHEEYKLESMTVTVQKQEENVQEVPVSVTTLSDIQIEDAGILNIEDVAYQVPNFHIIKTGSHNNGSRLVMRGLSVSNTQTVGFYVDDVYYSQGFDTELLDVERIEVLRGPQGTLFGRNSEAGVINIITQKPGSNQWQGKASVSYGNYNSQNYRAVIGGPLVQDKLFFRVSGKYFLSNGYNDNKFTGDDECDDMDDSNGRVILRWKPTDAWDINFVTEANRYRDGYNGFASLDDVRHDPHDVSLDFQGSDDTDAYGNSLRAEYSGKNFLLTSISSYRNWERDTIYDLDFTSTDNYRAELNDEIETWNQEFRVTSPNDSGPLKWLLGTNYFNEKKNIGTAYDYRQGFPAYGLSPYKQFQKSDLDTEGYAFFGQTTYTLFDRLDLTAGIRYEHEEKKLYFKEYYDQDLSMFSMVSQTKAPDAEDSDELLPKFALTYHWMPDLMTYTSVSKGYSSGSFNMYTSTSAGEFYDPEYSWNYEVGLKSAWLDKRLIFNFSVFYIDWKDQQVMQQTTPGEVIFKNAAESTSMGVEVEAMAKLAAGLEFTAGFGYTNVEFDDFKDTLFDEDLTSPTYGQAIGEIDYSDKKNTFVPQYTYNLGIQYRNKMGFFSRIELQGIGEYYIDFNNTEKQGAYELVNARLGYEWENFEVYLWVKNLFDKEYITAAFEATDGFVARSGNPQTFGITLTAHF